MAFRCKKKNGDFQTTKPDDGKDVVLPQYFVPSTSMPPTNAVILGVMRNPIERFRSGFSRAARGKTVDAVIDSLLASKFYASVDIHIQPVAQKFTKQLPQFQWYKYESQLEQLAQDIGLEEVPGIANESEQNEKPTLTENQITKLNEYYADDIAIYNSL